MEPSMARQHPDARAPGLPAADGVVLRRVTAPEEYAACVELQNQTWGDSFAERVPATILRIAQFVGGVTAGAFAADGQLLGFVFGITGVRDGRLVHWSDMLAVRAGVQGHGIGRRLKEFQRDAVRALGATRMYWTYDPLVARNAHFNLTRLGVRVAEYVPDMYGADTGSAMHSGFGTDRFVVVWPIEPAVGDAAGAPGTDADRAGGQFARLASAPGGGDAPVLNAGAAEGRDVDLSRYADAAPHAVRVEIPPDIFRVQAESVARAAHWRATTRRAFQWALASGYTVERFEHDGAAGRAFYLLVRTSPAAAPAAP